MRQNRDMSKEDYNDTLETTLAIKETGRFKTRCTSLLQACQWITEHKQCRRYKGMLLDHFSASAFMAVHNALSPEAKEKLNNLAKDKPVGAISICFQLLK